MLLKRLINAFFVLAVIIVIVSLFLLMKQ